MSVNILETPRLAEAVSPVSIQPGGGFCMNLELAWGRCRRAWLRRFRPSYVRLMAEKRQGECKDCPHDIIDARDLKFFKNVCGYWFREVDDAFRWRDRVGLARVGLAEAACVCAAFLALSLLFGSLAVLGHWIFWLPVPIIIVLWFELVFFFRDPERMISTDAAVLLSPADGTVTHVGEVEEEGFPNGRAFRISIFLSVFDVHVNRIPRAGRVTAVRYFKGCFLDARHADCAVRNEQLWVDMEETGARRQLRIKQISGAIARRIVCWLKPGDEVKAGERFGMIKFGSRTDVLIPTDEPFKVQVRVGDKVEGGSNALVRFLK